MNSSHTLIGVDLGGTNMRVGLINDGKIIELNTRRVNKNGTAEDIFNDLVLMIDSMIGEHTQGIGIGVPSIVDVEKGIVYDVTNIPQWKEMHLKSKLEQRFNVPVNVNNDANCFAAGEKFFGKAQPYHSFIGLIVGTGLGAGVVVKDHLYEGRNCGAGEFGCITYLDKNYEYYCSGQFFSNKYNTTAYDMAQRCLRGDREALAIYHEFGKHLGKAIQTILYAYDPEYIVLGGSVSNAFEFFREGMYESMKTFLFEKTLRNLKIEVSEVQNIAIYGAASLYYNSLVTVE